MLRRGIKRLGCCVSSVHLAAPGSLRCPYQVRREYAKGGKTGYGRRRRRPRGLSLVGRYPRKRASLRLVRRCRSRGRVESRGGETTETEKKELGEGGAPARRRPPRATEEGSADGATGRGRGERGLVATLEGIRAMFLLSKCPSTTINHLPRA